MPQESIHFKHGVASSCDFHLKWLLFYSSVLNGIKVSFIWLQINRVLDIKRRLKRHQIPCLQIFSDEMEHGSLGAQGPLDVGKVLLIWALRSSAWTATLFITWGMKVVVVALRRMRDQLCHRAKVCEPREINGRKAPFSYIRGKCFR